MRNTVLFRCPIKPKTIKLAKSNTFYGKDKTISLNKQTNLNNQFHLGQEGLKKVLFWPK